MTASEFRDKGRFVTTREHLPPTTEKVVSALSLAILSAASLLRNTFAIDGVENEFPTLPEDDAAEWDDENDFRLHDHDKVTWSETVTGRDVRKFFTIWWRSGTALFAPVTPEDIDPAREPVAEDATIHSFGAGFFLGGVSYIGEAAFALQDLGMRAMMSGKRPADIAGEIEALRFSDGPKHPINMGDASLIMWYDYAIRSVIQALKDGVVTYEQVFGPDLDAGKNYTGDPKLREAAGLPVSYMVPSIWHSIGAHAAEVKNKTGGDPYTGTFAEFIDANTRIWVERGGPEFAQALMSWNNKTFMTDLSYIQSDEHGQFPDDVLALADKLPDEMTPEERAKFVKAGGKTV